MNKQLTLGIMLRDDATFDNFFSGSNQQVLYHLREAALGKAENFIYLYGGEGAGISHLLQACCHEVFSYQKQALYLPLSERYLTPEVLQNLEQMDLICLDDLESVLGNARWEEALLHFYNRVRDQGKRLIIGAKCLPILAPCALLDLKSRLSWGLVLPVNLLTDDQKSIALQMRAQSRGLVMPLPVVQFLLRSYSRNMTQLFNFLDKLDKASLIEKRRLTIPFVKEVLLNDPR